MLRCTCAVALTINLATMGKYISLFTFFASEWVAQLLLCMFFSSFTFNRFEHRQQWTFEWEITNVRLNINDFEANGTYHNYRENIITFTRLDDLHQIAILCVFLGLTSFFFLNVCQILRWPLPIIMALTFFLHFHFHTKIDWQNRQLVIFFIA